MCVCVECMMPSCGTALQVPTVGARSLRLRSRRSEERALLRGAVAGHRAAVLRSRDRLAAAAAARAPIASAPLPLCPWCVGAQPRPALCLAAATQRPQRARMLHSSAVGAARAWWSTSAGCYAIAAGGVGQDAIVK